MKSIKYHVNNARNPITGRCDYLIAELIIEEQPNFYPVHITGPDWDNWNKRAFDIEKRYDVIVTTVF